MKQNEWQYCFLGFSGRSGSTLLCREIADNFSRVLVLPEFRLIEHLAVAINHEDRIPKPVIEKWVAMDRQLAEQPAVVARINEFLDSASPEITPVEILDIIVKGFTDRDDWKTVLIQFGAVAFHRKTMQSSIGARWGAALSIVRDPRAVTNSLLRTRRAYYPNEDMGRGDSVFCARRWRREQQALVRSVAHDNGKSIVIHYERLVRDTEAEMQRLADVLDPEYKKATGPSRGFHVAAREQSLHKNVASDPITDRIDAWQGELPAHQRSAVEAITYKTARDLGFDIPRPTIRNHVSAFALSLVSVRHQSRYVSRRVWQHRHEVGRVVLHARARWAGRRPGVKMASFCSRR